ncbi:DUF1800 domain-containing protein [Pigmentiphaga aceris]|uniref:DUF1800 domain-containing protein n=1 Tax=Pigmentiphaga aceris TaxID=1940612 RepID=A0A5C0AZ64_9BURK|nr:DUF1800 domain-containing protein [Pigmentiphaga aceris]QEI06703.1 DUF1800 domain-containing protein [Pigmentiphaga aceris]
MPRSFVLSPVPASPRRLGGIVSAVLATAALLAACSTPPAGRADFSPQGAYAWVDRISWGANPSTLASATRMGRTAWLNEQLHPTDTALPASVQAQIDAMPISREPTPSLLRTLSAANQAANALTDDAAKQAARQVYQQDLNELARQAESRALLRAVYSPAQLQEQMSWFWVNHFGVFRGKRDIRALVGDYEEQAIRPYALGRFRDLLGAVVRHPAMLRYLDNDQNAVGKINENYARELMELHTLGVDGGYQQADVQMLAQVLTGVGVRVPEDDAKIRPALQAQYVRTGLFEFNPARHDATPKTLLGAPLHAKGLAEVDEALDRLARHPSTARFIARKLVTFFVSDDPPPALVDRVAQAFLHTDGDIAKTLKVLFDAPEFSASLGQGFKDPVHYVVSAVRLAYGDRPLEDTAPMQGWIRRLGQARYGHVAPDGYPMLASAWNGSGQLATRFEIARAIGTSDRGLFGAAPPAAPILSGPWFTQHIAPSLSPATRDALAQAKNAQEWNTFLLSSPEFMAR